MKQLKTKTKLVARFLFVAILGLSVLSGCKAYDKDIDGLNAGLEKLDKDLNAKLEALRAETQAALDAKVNELKGDIADLASQIAVLQGKVAHLEETSATKEELDAAKADLEAKITALRNDLESKYVTIVALNAYKAEVETRFEGLNAEITAINTELVAVNAELAKKADKTEITRLDAELARLEGEITRVENKLNAELTRINGALETLGADVIRLDGLIDGLDGKITVLDGKITTLDSKIDGVASDLATKYGELKGLIGGLDGRVTTLESTKADKTELAALENELKGLIQANTDAIGENADAIAINALAIEALEDALDDLADKVAENATAIEGLIEDLGELREEYEAKVLEIDGKIATIQNDVADLQDDVSDLKGDVADLKDAVIALEEAVADLEEAVEDLQDQINEINEAIKALEKKMNLKFFNFSRRLTSLVYVADLYVNGVEAMKFSTLGYDCDGADVEITKDLEIQYRLNPSTVTAEDIDTEGLYFDVRKSTNIVGYLGALPNEDVIKANFVSIVDGVLTVSVSIEDFDEVFGDTGMTYNGNLTFNDKFTQVSLVVPMSEKVLAEMPEEFENLEEASVAAEYVRLYREVLSAEDLALAMLDEEGELVDPLALLVDNAEDAKDYEVKGVDGATASDPQVVVLPYADGEVDLVEWVTTVLGADEFEDFDAFGLVYNFDLLDEEGDEIEYERNSIDQQQFITVEDGVAVRNDDIEQSVISASLGRTPIVRVWVSEAGKDCPILIGFIKVYVEEKPLPPITIVRECEEPVEFSTLECEQFCYEGCEELPAGEVYNSQEVVLEILEKTNFVFDADDNASIAAAYAEFKALYTDLDYSEGADARIKEVGTDGAYEWCVPAADILLALLEKNPATISDTLTFKSEYPALYPEVQLIYTQEFNIDAVNLPLGNLIAEYWYDMDGGNNGAAFDEVKHNIFVPVANENDPANAVFETDLGSAFLQDASLNLKDIPASYEFFFLENQPIVDGMDNPLVVSADGKQLLNPDDLSEVVAEIHERNNSDGEVLELKEDSDLAKELLNLDKENLRARIGMRYMPCPDILDAEDNEIWLPVTINNKESFDVVFVRPISASGVSPEDFIDGPAYGVEGTYIDVASLVSLYDWRNYSFEDPNSGNDLYEYYDVESISIDVSEIETDLNQAGAGRVNLQTTFPSLQVKTEATMAGNTPDHGFLTYKNNGVVIGSDFHLFVPVTIEYKWGEIVATEVVVTVKKTIGPSGVIKK